MIVYRLTKSKHGQDLSGLGSTLVEGRWHRPAALPVLYTASNRSLAILEVLAHLPSPVVKPPRLTMLEIFVPDTSVKTIRDSTLPKGWPSRSYQLEVQEWGTEWLRLGESLAISVPSVISRDRNILVNPTHRDFHKVRVVKAESDFLVDERLI